MRIVCRWECVHYTRIHTHRHAYILDTLYVTGWRSIRMHRRLLLKCNSIISWLNTALYSSSLSLSFANAANELLFAFFGAVVFDAAGFPRAATLDHDDDDEDDDFEVVPLPPTVLDFVFDEIDALNFSFASFCSYSHFLANSDSSSNQSLLAYEWVSE